MPPPPPPHTPYPHPSPRHIHTHTFWGVYMRLNLLGLQECILTDFNARNKILTARLHHLEYHFGPASVVRSDVRLTGDQEVADSIPAGYGNILSWRLIMTYFLRSLFR